MKLDIIWLSPPAKLPVARVFCRSQIILEKETLNPTFPDSTTTCIEFGRKRQKQEGFPILNREAVIPIQWRKKMLGDAIGFVFFSEFQGVQSNGKLTCRPG
jgi:hypothetical protein